MPLEGKMEIILELLKLIGVTPETVTVLSVLISTVILIKQQIDEYRGNALIPFKIQIVGQDKVLYSDFKIHRKDVKRAEVLGLMGMMSRGKRVSLEFLSSPALLKNIQEVGSGKASTLVIECSEEEFKQFL